MCVQDLLNKTLSVTALQVKPGRNICASYAAKGEDEIKVPLANKTTAATGLLVTIVFIND